MKYTLWFDVGQGYKTMMNWSACHIGTLWFDVGQGYKTIQLCVAGTECSCGLM